MMETGASMDKTIRKVTDLVEQQAETYRYWRSRPSAERFKATWEISRETYTQYYRERGIPEYVEGSARSITRIQRPQR
jgi:hypothetical protein